MTRHAINYDTHEYLCGSTHGEMADFNIDTTCVDCADSILDGGPGGHATLYQLRLGYYESIADEGEGQCVT